MLVLCLRWNCLPGLKKKKIRQTDGRQGYSGREMEQTG